MAAFLLEKTGIIQKPIHTALLRNIYVCLVPILYIHCSQAERLFLYRFKSVIKGKKTNILQPERDGREKKHKNFHLIYACQREGTTTTGLILNDVDISRRRARKRSNWFVPFRSSHENIYLQAAYYNIEGDLVFDVTD